MLHTWLSMNSLLPNKLVDLAETVVTRNAAHGRTVCVAESCTGGLVSAALTEVPGSSRIFERGYVTYSNAAKSDVLGVSEDLIATFGAVSIAVAWAMAQAALKKSGADVVVAITGVAGPDGGTEQKPVGTVVFACARKDEDPEEIVAEMKKFGAEKSRADIRLQAAVCALELLLP